MKTWIIVDANNLAHRAFHTTGALTNNQGVGTGVIYGFLRQVKALEERFGSQNFVFCFDRGPYLRQKDHPFYKANRGRDRQNGIFEKARRSDLDRQVNELREKRLPQLGYQNILSQEGYEADDLIASVALFSLGNKERAIIISSDHDLYQLLLSNNFIYNPHSKIITTEKTFRDKFDIDPVHWSKIKAIAGCKSDNITGVFGVAEQSAAAYLNGTLNKASGKYQKIKQFVQSNAYDINLLLIALPYANTKQFELKPQEKLQQSNSDRVFEEIGFPSMIGS